MLRLGSGGQHRHSHREGPGGLAAGLPHAAIIVSGDGKAVAAVMMVVAVPAAAVVKVVERDLIPGIGGGWQRHAGANGPGHVREIRGADGQRTHGIGMRACDRDGHEAEMEKSRFHKRWMVRGEGEG